MNADAVAALLHDVLGAECSGTHSLGYATCQRQAAALAAAPLPSDTPAAPKGEAMTAQTDDTAMRLHATTDAKVWTDEFYRIFGNDDKVPEWDTMLGWFANAIETGRDAGTPLPSEPRSCDGLCSVTHEHALPSDTPHALHWNDPDCGDCAPLPSDPGDDWRWECVSCNRPVPPKGMCETCGIFGVMRLAATPPPSDTPAPEDHGNPDYPMKQWSEGFYAALEAIRNGDPDARRGVGWPSDTPADGLDVERLTRALWVVEFEAEEGPYEHASEANVIDVTDLAEAIAREYAALALTQEPRPGDDR